MHTKFLLLLGVSGVGKTTIIKELLKLDASFVYISPLVTRPIRNGETDKISVTEGQLQTALTAGKILVVNDIYGIRYGTPKGPIQDAFRACRFPLLDWPIKRLYVMEREFGDWLYRVYVEPPNITELKRRLGQDERDQGGIRLLAAIKELEQLQCGELDGKFDMLVTADGDPAKIAKIIYAGFMFSLT